MQRRFLLRLGAVSFEQVEPKRAFFRTRQGLDRSLDCPREAQGLSMTGPSVFCQRRMKILALSLILWSRRPSV